MFIKRFAKAWFTARGHSVEGEVPLGETKR